MAGMFDDLPNVQPAAPDRGVLSPSGVVGVRVNTPQQQPAKGMFDDLPNVSNFSEVWGNTSNEVPPAQNQPSPLSPEVDRVLAQQAPNNPQARVEQHIRRMEGERQDATPDIFMQGLTLGASDEVGAALQRLRGMGNYGELLDAERERLARVKKDQPVASTLVEIAGAIANPVSRMGLAANAATRGERFARGALEAGALGGVYGFNQGEGGFENRVSNLATSALIAAPVGGAINAILPAVRGAVQTTPGSLVSEAADRIGVQLPRAVTADNRAIQQAGKGLTNIPLAGLPLRGASERAIGQLDEAATRVQQGFGNSDPARAGDIAATGLERFISKTTKDKAEKLYKAVDGLVDETITTPLANAQQIALRILDRRNNAGITQESEAVRRIKEAILRPDGLNYKGVKDLRSWIGETLDTGILPVDLSKAELKQIYGSLTKDLRASVTNAGGQEALAKFNRANSYFDAASTRRESLMRIVGAKSDEAVFNRILAAANNKNGDNALLAQVRRSLPADEWNEITSAIIARMGRDPKFVTTPGTTTTQTGFSPDRFMSAYGDLSPAGKSLLFRSTGKGDLANALDDIATVSQRFKQLNTFANPSGTAQNAQFGVGGFALASNPVTTIGTIVPAAVMSWMLSRPQSAQSIAKWSNAYYNAVAKPTRASMQALDQATRTFADDIGRQLGVPQHAEALFRQLQGAVRAPAEEQSGQ
jgi:hypothetical protein